MRQQQPRIVAPAPRHLLAVVIDRLLHPVDRPVGQHRFGRPAGAEQRRIPGKREPRTRPPRPVRRLRRDTRRPAGEPDIAEQLQMLEEIALTARREHGEAPLGCRSGGIGEMQVDTSKNPLFSA
ncbi:MAG: hypothetical protein V2J14_02885 [Erythrobacter sp.]|nr:hypothetical protein [Erythrobacter sp.]